MGKFKHGHGRRSERKRTWRIWQSMRARCTYPSQDSYPLYGGRGITVCERWSEYGSFLADMGECPPGYTLDRIDSDGHYEPGNCRWAPNLDQQRNRRNNHMIEFSGETKPLSEWAEIAGMPPHSLRARIVDYGWSPEKAITTPLRRDRRRKNDASSGLDSLRISRD